MINIFLFLAFVFLFTFTVGSLIEKIRVPWIFAALILGFLLAVHNPFAHITSAPTFDFLAQLGMFFLLFVIGFEINLKEIKRDSVFLIKSTIFIIFLEAFFGSLIIHFMFGYGWFLSAIVAVSFATVGEAILIPILDEFGITNTRLGQAIIGIGSLDDVIEILILVVVISMIGLNAHAQISVILVSLFVLFALTVGLAELREDSSKFGFIDIETLFLFTLFVLFLFLGIGEYAEATSLAALLAGVSLRTFIPKKRLNLIENEVKTMCYGFFAPIFFLWVGLGMNIAYILAYPLLIVLVVGVSNGAKILGGYIMARKELGVKKSILLGIGLSVRFSTSIIIIKILFENNLIDSRLYSVILASTIAFTFIVPILFSNLLVGWNITEQA